MPDITFLLLSFLLLGEYSQKRRIIDSIRPEYFYEAALAEIFLAAKSIVTNGGDANILSVLEKLTRNEDKKTVKNVTNIFREYFYTLGDLDKNASDDDVRQQIGQFLASFSVSDTFTVPLDAAIKQFLEDYVNREKTKLLQEYQKTMKNNASSCSFDDFASKIKGLDDILNDKTWKKYQIDFDQLLTEPEELPIIVRKGVGMFFRGNVYVISGSAGTMKSFLCFAIAAASLNKGILADNTLSFYATSPALKVLYADTELAKNTIKQRFLSLKKMVGNELDSNRFVYLSLRAVSGDLKAKLSVLDTACRQCAPDVIILDSGRDLCADFNDIKETSALVEHFCQLASDYHAVLLTTSHQSLQNGNAKGHLGMRLTEKAGLVMSLKKSSFADSNSIQVEFPKEREGNIPTFSFRFNAESGILEEDTPTIDKSEESRQFKNAKECVEKVIRPGMKISKTNLIKGILKQTSIEGKEVTKKTARNYVTVLAGKFIRQENDYFILSNPNVEIPYNDDLPDD